MFSKFFLQKIQGKGNMSDCKERLLNDDIADSEEELVEKMSNLSLKSKRPQLKQDTDKKISIPHSFHSSHENQSHQRKSGRLGFMNQPLVQLRGMFPSVRGPQKSSIGELNQNFIFAPYQQDLSMQRNPTEPERPSSPKDKLYRKVINDLNFFNGGHGHTHHHCVLLIPKKN